MEKFAIWFIDFFQKLLVNIGDALARFFINIYDFFVKDFVGYYNDFVNASKDFGIIEWSLSVLSMFIVLLLILSIIYLIILLLRRYIRFTKNERNKEELLYEVGNLNYQISVIQDEKNAILALSDSGASNYSKQTQEEVVVLDKPRFERLMQIDEKYHRTMMPTVMNDSDKVNLKELIDLFIRYSATSLGLYYSYKTIQTFFAGMAASKILILEGISGTGKTSLPYALGKFFTNDASIISVQPSWRNRTEMMGYLNEFTKRFNETDFLNSVYEATYRTDINLIVLDEMNLARVEYYFADFLSLLEMPDPSKWLVEIVPSQLSNDPHQLDNGKILIPENIWFVGTANKDDSTFTITDKVYDRATSIEMNQQAELLELENANPVKISYEYLIKLFNKAQKENPISESLLEKLKIFDQFIIQKFEISFGNRVMKQIKAFIPVYVECGGKEIQGLDYMVSRKVIRRFESLNLPFLKTELTDLRVLIERLFGEGEFLECHKMIDLFSRYI